jgi:cytosine/adenosine deaminase-related metal-dependent hydrolase
VTATLHTAATVLPVGAPPIRAGAVAVDGDRVVWVGPRRDWTGEGPVESWPGLLAPGLVNGHCHLQYTAYADMCEPGVDFLDWISVFARRNPTMTDADWQASADAGVGELLRTGTTAVADVVASPAAVRAAEPLAGVSYVEAVGVDGAGWPAHRPVLLDRLAARTGRAVGVSPHTLYSLGSGVVRDCVAVARERGLRLHPHLAESPYEVEYVATGTGPFADAMVRWGFAMELVTAGGSARTPAAELAGLGALGPDVHVAHGVHCDAADRALLRAHRTTVTLCPRSNRVLGVGEAPVAAYRAEGSPVAVGTDSRASAPSLDLLADVADLRATALRQGSPAAGLDRWLVEAATIGGARAMGLDAGTVVPGGRADLAVFDIDPGGDPYAALAGAAGRCVGTVLSGRVVHDLRV